MKPLLIVLLLGAAISWAYHEDKQHRELLITLDQTRAQLREAQNQLQAAKLQMKAQAAGSSGSAAWMWKSDPLNPSAAASGQRK